MRIGIGETAISATLLEVSVLVLGAESTSSGTSAVKAGTSSMLVTGAKVI